jgi:hypothetical protein
MRNVIAIALLAASCGKSEKPPPPPPPPAEGLELVDPGLPPLAVMHYQLAKGTRTAIEMSLDAELTASSGNRPMPTLVVDTDVTAEDVLPDGSIRVRTAVTAVTARDRAGSGLTGEQLSGPMQILVGTSLVGTVTPSGVLGNLVTDLGGKVVPPALDQQLATLRTSFEQLAMPLPAQPIGIGALWRYNKSIDQGGMKMTSATTVKITAITGTTMTFALSSEVTGPDQTLTQAGTTIQIKNIAGKARGTGTLDLATMTIAGELAAELHSDMADASSSERIGMTTTTKLRPAPQGAQKAP